MAPYFIWPFLMTVFKFQLQHVELQGEVTAGERAPGASSRSPSEVVPITRAPLQDQADPGATHSHVPGDIVTMNVLDVCI